MDRERFDITAKIPQGAAKEQFRVMMQNLLKERFKLEVHHEQKEMPGFQFVVAKGGPKLTKAVEEPAAKAGGPKGGAPPGGPPKFTMDKGGYPVLHPANDDHAERAGTHAVFRESIGTVRGDVGKPVGQARLGRGRAEGEVRFQRLLDFGGREDSASASSSGCGGAARGEQSG